MTDSQLHIIDRQVFEVEFFSREEAPRIQDRLSKLFNEKIIFLMEKLFDRLVLPDEYFNISSLTINIGKFSEDWEEEELAYRIIEAIEQELAQLLARQFKNQSYITGKNKLLNGNKSLQLLDHFLHHGSLPWWAPAGENPNWSALMAELFISSKSDLSAAILNSGKLSSIRSRLVYQFDNPAIYLVLKLIEPDHAEYIKAFHTDLAKQQLEKQLVKSNFYSFEKSVWEFILDYLFIENQSFFNKLSFVEATIIRLAAHYNLSYEQVLQLFTKAIPIATRTVTPDLPDLLLILSAKHSHNLDQTSNEKALDLFNFYLQNGHLPWWSTEISDLNFDSLFKKLVTSAPDLAVKLIRHAGTSDVARARLLKILPVNSFIYGLLNAFPVSKKGSDAYQYLIEKLSVIRLFALNDIISMQKNLVGILWEQLRSAGYVTFDVPNFLQEAISYLSMLAGVPLVEMLWQILSVTKDIITEPYSSMMRDLLDNKKFIARDGRQDRIFYELIHQSDPSRFAQPNAWLTTNFTDTQNDGQSLKVLHHFLQSGHLPYEYGFTKKEEEKLQSAITTYDNQQKRSENPIRAFSIGHRSYAIEELLTIAKEAEIWIGSDGQLALRAIRYFISTGSLPSHYTFSNANDELALLRQLLILAERENQTVFREIFHNTTFQRQTVVKLLQLVYLPDEYTAIAGVLESYLDDHILIAFKDWGLVKEASQDTSLLAIFSGTEENRMKVFFELLVHSQLRIYIAKSNSVEDIVKVIDKQSAGWKTEELKATIGLYHWMDMQMKDSLEKEHLSILFKEFLLLQLINKESFKDQSSFFKSLLTFLSSRRHVIFLHLLEAISLVDPEVISSGEAPEWNKKEIVKLARDYFDKEKILHEVRQADLKLLLPSQTDTSLLQKEEESFTDFDLESDHELSGASFYVQNAGLVLLHPYLKTFFNNLGLIKEGKFTSNTARFKAIHVLQFLIDGEFVHPEHTLILNKVLCGLPVQAPVPLSVKLTAVQQQHCKDFISAILSMWEQMKNSSHANFRGAFLKRDGILKNEYDDWNLKVEPAGYDVLLQTLPWGYGIVKNGLMKSTIYVEWI